jgi:hypothetical protein
MRNANDIVEFYVPKGSTDVRYSCENGASRIRISGSSSRRSRRATTRTDGAQTGRAAADEGRVEKGVSVVVNRVVA